MITCPVLYAKFPLARDDTTLPTSPGSPQRFCTHKPSLISLSYFSLTPAVMSVCIIPGLTSNTGILNSPNLTANNCVAMPSPAFEIQYSPRFVETTVADMEEILIMHPVNDSSFFFCSIIQL